MLATVREFALGRLEARPDVDAIRRRHAEHVLAVVSLADEAASGPGEAASLAEIARRHDDVRAALDWTETARADELALGLVTATGWFWYVRGYLAEGRARLETALSHAGAGDSALRAIACMRVGSIADAQVDVPAAERYLPRGARDPASSRRPCRDVRPSQQPRQPRASVRRLRRGPKGARGEPGARARARRGGPDCLVTPQPRTRLSGRGRCGGCVAAPRGEPRSRRGAPDPVRPRERARKPRRRARRPGRARPWGGAPGGEHPAASRARCDRIAAADDRGSGGPRRSRPAPPRPRPGCWAPRWPCATASARAPARATPTAPPAPRRRRVRRSATRGSRWRSRRAAG